MPLRRRFQYDVETHPELVPAPSGTGVGFPSTNVVSVPSSYQFQYQSQAYTPFIPTAEVITEDKWHFPWSVPVRQRIAAGAAIALMASGLFATPPQPAAAAGTGVVTPITDSVGVQFKERRQYQAYTTSYVVTAAEVVTVDKWVYPWSNPVRLKTGLGQQYQQAFVYGYGEVVTPDKWTYPWSEPVRQKPGLRAQLQQTATGPVLEPNTQIIQTFESRWHYPWSEPVRKKPALQAGLQFAATPAFTSETVTVDKWTYPWSEPVRQKPGLRAHLQQSLIATTLNPETQLTQFFESRWHYAWSEPVRTRLFPTAEQQAFAFQPPSFEVVTVDKWIYPWSEPVRQKPGLKANLQQSLAATTLNPETQLTQFFESRWHYAWSEPVRLRRLATAQQVSHTEPPTSAFEVVTIDKWFAPWREPVRQKPGLSAGLQQAYVNPSFTPAAAQPGTGIVTPIYDSVGVQFRERRQYQALANPLFFRAEVVTVDKWFAPWREPVRQRPGLGVSQQQAFTAPALPQVVVVPTATSVGVQFTRARQYQTYANPVFTPTAEVITVDKWIYPWRDPIRQKPGLRAHLQQALIATTLNPETQITQTFESRWHYPWSEPVRVRRLAVAQQQAVAQPASSVFETITPDKWIYPWSEPVRQKPGLRAALQQALIATTLEPNTQIIQGFESRWHYPWTEPVRFRPALLAGLQQAYTAPLTVAEVVTVDKWVYPWSEPVRQKPRLSTNLQQVFAYGYGEVVTEDKWHYPWSEPIRQKPGLRTSLQQALALVLDPNTQITQGFESRWHYPWTEPVRQKPGLRAYLQPTFVLVLDPKTQLTQFFESRWHYPWSEPVRLRRFPTAEQQFLAFQLDPKTQITQNFESRWHYSWSEPVRQKPGLRVALQPFFPAWGIITPPPIVIFEGSWHYPWSEPVRQKPGFKAYLQQSLIATTLDPKTQITQFFESRWHYPWSEPVRQKPGLKGYLHQITPVPVLNPNTQITQFFESRWHYPWSEPVRLKKGLRGYLHPFLTNAFPVRPFDITGTLFAIEQGDLFTAFGSTFTQVGSALVGVQFDRPLHSALVGIQFDKPLDSAKVGMVEATTAPTPGSVSSPVFSANVSIRKV